MIVQRLSRGLLILAALCGSHLDAGEPERGWPAVCRNPELIKAVSVIERACSSTTCDPRTLRELDTSVDKPAFLRAMRDPNLAPIHVFFPSGETDLRKAFDWSRHKRDQLATLKFDVVDPTNAIIFVLAQTSPSGDAQFNARLSRERMINVVKYLQDVLKIRCRSFRGGWLGEDIFTLKSEDARFLGIDPREYRHSEAVLNQSVHIFVYPCADLLPD